MQKPKCATIFLLLNLCVHSLWAASSFDGDWVGGFERSESQVYVEAHFATATNGTTAKIDAIDPLYKGKLPQIDLQFEPVPGYVPNTWIVGRPMDKLVLSPPHAHFELADQDSPMSFDGRATNGVMTGMVKDRGMQLPFRLDLTAKIDPSRYVGSIK